MSHLHRTTQQWGRLSCLAHLVVVAVVLASSAAANTAATTGSNKIPQGTRTATATTPAIGSIGGGATTRTISAARKKPLLLSPIDELMVGPVDATLVELAVPQDVDGSANHTVLLHIVGSWQELTCCDAYGDIRLLQLPGGGDPNGRSGDGRSGDGRSGDGRSGDGRSGGGKSGDGKSGGGKSGGGPGASPVLLKVTRASHKDSPLGEPRDLDYVEEWADVRVRPGGTLRVQVDMYQGFFPQVWAEVQLRYKPAQEDGSRGANAAGAAASVDSLGRKALH